MDWNKGRESNNVVEDDGSGGGGSGGGGLRFGGLHIGLGGILIIVLGSLLMGKNPLDVLGYLANTSSDSGSGQTAPQSAPPQATGNDPQTKFVRVVLGSTEDVWGAYFQSGRQPYEQPKLDLFHGRVASACGMASEAMGPFYCPGDHRVYLDLDFFHEMDTRFHATGDFARAYVIAHEVGHHVQNLLGIMAQVDQAQRRGESMEGANGLSVRLELQADCFAGVWGNRSQQQLNWLQPGDVDSALNAAAQVGDDTLQKQARGRVMPDSFTHGTAVQRAHWFKAGFTSGDIKSCDTFGAATL